MEPIIKINFITLGQDKIILFEKNKLIMKNKNKPINNLAILLSKTL